MACFFRTTFQNFITFSAPKTEFRTFQGLKNQKMNFVAFQDPWQPWVKLTDRSRHHLELASYTPVLNLP